jgi:hypothetical protein
VLDEMERNLEAMHDAMAVFGTIKGRMGATHF